ncbi:MAG: gas vesicle protein [Planctomycetes bacterium]|nr:gas vesicle protein [Planctomycetota bacterium]
MGGDEFQPSPFSTYGGGEVLEEERTGGFEIPPLLEDQRISLCETLDRVLNTGVVVHGDITISVANIDLIYIGLRALLTSVETARQSGINQ